MSPPSDKSQLYASSKTSGIRLTERSWASHCAPGSDSDKHRKL